MEKGISGFRAFQLWPMDPNQFSEDDFTPTDHTSASPNNIQIQIKLNKTDDGVNNREKTVELSNEIGQNTPQTGTIRCDETIQKSPPREPQPGSSCGEIRHRTPPPKNSKCQSNAIHFSPKVSIEKLAPLPGSILRKGVKQREKQHSEVFASTPLKTHLELNQEKKNLKKRKEELKKSEGRKRKSEKVEELSAKVKKRHLKKKPGLRRLHFDYSDSESCDESQLCDDDELDDMYPSTGNDECLVCGEFGRDKEIWYRCVICSNWAHSECSGWDSTVNYKCDTCVTVERKKHRT